MVGPALDYLRNPLGAVRSLFAKACTEAGNGDGAMKLSKSDWGVKELFDKCLFQDGLISQVPEINTVRLDSIPVNSLVRFHGMVQDMFDVEYYVGIQKNGGTWRTNKYSDDVASEELHQLEHQIWDRRLFYCVPVPGENVWVKEARFTSSANLEPVVAAEEHPKRQREPVFSENVDMDCDVPGRTEDIKKMRIVAPQQEDKESTAMVNCGLSMSADEFRQLSCLVKIYDACDADLKLNDIVEFVGVLTFDPLIRPQGLPSISDSFMEDDISVQLPASKVPRLHCITLRKLTAYSILHQLSPHSHFNLALARESLLRHLDSVLAGDRLAAEYLLLHLLSRVHSRVEPVAVGKLSLNITGCQGGNEGALSPLAVSIGRAISKLLPCSQMLPLSLQNLNGKLLAPRKDYASNRLVTGALQLAASTHLTVDETALNTGCLNDTGVKNLQLLKNMIQNQKVDYDFQYYNMEMATDVPVLVVSTGKSRLLPADALVPLRCSADQVQDFSCPKEADLATWRRYLATVREAEHVIDASIQKMLEDDLVAARQRDRTVGPDTFHKWLTMARLASLSFGERSLTLERWGMVKDMETSCSSRLGA